MSDPWSTANFLDVSKQPADARARAVAEAARFESPVRFVEFAQIPVKDQAKVRELIADAQQKHGVDPIVAEAILPALLAASRYNGVAASIFVEVPARQYAPDHVPTADDDFLRTTRGEYRVEDGVPLFINSARTMAARRPIAAAAAERAAAHELLESRRRQQQQARTGAENERLAIWRSAQFERALFMLAERVAASPDEAKRLRDPVALIRAIATATINEPLDLTSREIPDAAIKAFAFAPLPTVDAL